MTFDGHTYEQEQGAKYLRTTRPLLDSDAFMSRVDTYGAGPTIGLECGRGHRLLTIKSDINGDRIVLAALPDHRVRKSGAITSYAEPWRLSRVCLKHGCPTIVPHEGYCTEHGGPLEWIGTIRTRFTCRRNGCGWSEPVTTARLLEFYGLAVVMGWTSISLNYDSRSR